MQISAKRYLSIVLLFSLVLSMSNISPAKASVVTDFIIVSPDTSTIAPADDVLVLDVTVPDAVNNGPVTNDTVVKLGSAGETYWNGQNLYNFASLGTVDGTGFIDRGAAGYDSNDPVFRDLDGDGENTSGPDLMLDCDGAITAGQGTCDVHAAGDAMVALDDADNICVDNTVSATTVIFIDGDDDAGCTFGSGGTDVTLLGSPINGSSVYFSLAIGGVFIDSVANDAYDAGEDLYLEENGASADKRYSASADVEVYQLGGYSAGTALTDFPADCNGIGIGTAACMFNGDNSVLDQNESIFYDNGATPNFIDRADDQLLGLAVSNFGSADNINDISLLSLWLEEGSHLGFQLNEDTRMVEVFTAGADTNTWFVDLSGSPIAIPAGGLQLYITATISPIASLNASIVLNILPFLDVNSDGTVDDGDQGVFVSSTNDGPTNGNTGNANIITIDAAGPTISRITTKTQLGNYPVNHDSVLWYNYPGDNFQAYINTDENLDEIRVCIGQLTGAVLNGPNNTCDLSDFETLANYISSGTGLGTTDYTFNTLDSLETIAGGPLVDMTGYAMNVWLKDTLGNITLVSDPLQAFVMVWNVEPSALDPVLNNPGTTVWADIDDFTNVLGSVPTLTFRAEVLGSLLGELSFPSGTIDLTDPNTMTALQNLGQNMMISGGQADGTAVIGLNSDALFALNLPANLTVTVPGASQPGIIVYGDDGVTVDGYIDNTGTPVGFGPSDAITVTGWGTNELTFSTDGFSFFGTDNTAPELLYAKATAPTTIILGYSEPVNTVAGDYTNFTDDLLAGNCSVDTVGGSGTALITLNLICDVGLTTPLIGSMDIAGVTDIVGNVMVSLPGQSIDDELTASSTIYVDDSWTGPANAGGHTWGVDAFATIQGGVDAVVEGGTVNVAVGTYEENLTINKAISVIGDIGSDGVGAGPEAPTIIDSSGNTRTVDIIASDVVFRGFIVENDGGSWPAVRIAVGINNATVKNNNLRNAYSGVTLASNSYENIVTKNKIYNTSNGIFINRSITNTISYNEIYDNSYGIEVVGDNDASGNDIDHNSIYDNSSYGIAVEGGVTADPAILIQNNTIDNSNVGIYVGNLVIGISILGNTITENLALGTAIEINSIDQVVAHLNVISGNISGVDNFAIDPFDATRNYWGEADGPSGEGTGNGDSISTMIDYEPYYIDSELTTLNDTTNISIGDLEPIEINTDDTDEDEDSLDVFDLMTDVGDGILEGELPEITINTTTDDGDVVVEIPAGTTVTGEDGWDGTINTPTVKADSSVTVAGGTVSEVIEVGFDNIMLTFDQGVRILFSGEGGKKVGYSRDGVFTEISSTCAADDQITGDALDAGADCKITVGLDMVVWTKHFTSFVTYTTTTSGGGGGNPAPDTLPPTNTGIIINSGDTQTGGVNVRLTLVANGAKDMMISNSSDFAGAEWETFVTSKDWSLLNGYGTKTVHAKFRDTAGNLSQPVSDTISFVEVVTTPVTINEPIGSESEGEVTDVDSKTGDSVTYSDPANKTALLRLLNIAEDLSCENQYAPLLNADLAEFKVSMTNDQKQNALTFVCYGISTATKALGTGERRALIRDYLQTAGYSNIYWGDIARNALGKKLVHRNLANEQAQVGVALGFFKKIFSHNPVFTDIKEDLSWNTLMYRIRFVRDLEKERAAIIEFRRIFGRNPISPLDWSAVRILGYIK